MNPKALKNCAGHALYLQLAGTCFEIYGIPEKWLGHIPAKLLTCQVNTPVSRASGGRLGLKLLHDAAHLRPPAVAHDLHETSRLDFGSNQIGYSSDWCEGRLLLGSGLLMELDCHVEAGPWFGGLLENVLRVMVAYDVLNRGGLLMHSAAILMSQQARVLFGHSGAGKSTTSAIAMKHGYAVLSDDINVLLPSGSGWTVVRVPFCGTVGSTVSEGTCFPLGGLFSLHKSTRSELRTVSEAHATTAVCGSAPFVNQDCFRADQLLDNAQQLVRDIPLQQLYFRPDRFFLDLISGTQS